MTRVRYVLKEIGRNLRRQPSTALGSLLSLTLLFLLFDFFWVVSATSDRFYRDLLSEIRMEVFLPEYIPDSATSDLSQSVVALDGVQSAAFISKEEARAELSRLLDADLLIGYDSTNPLPRSLLLEIDPQHLRVREMAELENKLARLTGSSEIHYSRHWLEKAESTKSLMLRLGLVIGLLILLTTLISSVNSIRLMARARATGFRQMILLGAGKLLISFPFILEGFLLTGFSAAAGWGAIFYARGKIEFSQFPIIYPEMGSVVLFCLLVALLGGLSGYVGIRRMLR